jgi:hypothetical protein
MVYTQTREFLKQKGLQIGDSEPINIQILCRDPDSASRTLNMVVIRKAFRFNTLMNASYVFVI